MEIANLNEFTINVQKLIKDKTGLDSIIIYKNQSVSTDIEKYQIIETIVTDYFKIPLVKLKSQSRLNELVFARQIVSFFCNKYTKLTLLNIAINLNKKDHSVINHSLNTIKNLLQVDKNVQKIVTEIEVNINKYINKK